MQDNEKNSLPKGAKAKRRLLVAAEWVLIITTGILIGWFVPDFGFLWLVFLVVALLPILLFFHWLKNKKFAHLYEKPKCETDDESEEASDGNKINTDRVFEMKGPMKYVLLVMQMCAGGLFGYSAVSILFRLIDGNNDGFLTYLGMIGAAVVIFAIAIILQTRRDEVLKKEFSNLGTEIKLTETDERVTNLSYKAGYISMWSVLAMLLFFGGAVAAVPIENPNTIAVGMLMICAAGVVIYATFFTRFQEGKDLSPCRVKLAFTFFGLSLIPLALIVLQWIFNGLSATGIAFFAAFVIVSVALLAEAIMQKKFKKGGSGNEKT